MELDQRTLQRLSRQIRHFCGLVVTSEKEYLLRDRLLPVLHQHGLSSFAQLADRLDAAAEAALADEVVEAIVTHETAFFRDPHVWEALRDRILPRLIETRSAASPRLRLWSAAASTGEEPYTMAILVRECVQARFGDRPPHEAFSILATDICASAVAAGMAGRYEAWQLRRGISDERRARHFEPLERRWQVRESLRRMIDFRRINLVQNLPRLGPFHLICCRNVLIYFDESTRCKVCDQLHALLDDGGWLLLGAAENLYGISDRFESVSLGTATIYRKRG